MFSKFSTKDLIAGVGLYKLFAIFIIMTAILWSPSIFIDSMVEGYVYFYSAILLILAFILLYMQSSYLLEISKETSTKEKIAVTVMWFCAITIIIVAFSILHALVNTSDGSNYIYFSVITFTTVGYGDISPEGWWAYTFCGLEALLGLFSLGILIASVEKVVSIEKINFLNLVVSLLVLIIIPSLIYANTGIIDNDSKEVSKGFFDASYFSVVTLTSLGYGDFYPTEGSQVVVVFQSIIGYLYFGIVVAAMTARYFPLSRDDQ